MLLLEKDSPLADSIAVSPNFSNSGSYDRKSKWVVLHTMETGENSSIAENIGAGWFTNPNAQASAHYCVDDNSIVQCVNEGDYAWASGPTGNLNGIQIEMAGRAAQSRADWLDDYSRAMLERTAALTADICKRHGIPVRVLTDEQVARGEAGITTHASLARVFRETDHSDPGPDFPWDFFMERVQAHAGGNGGSVNEPAPAPAPAQAQAQPAGPTPLPEGVWYNARGWFTANTRLEISGDTEVDSPALGYYAPGGGFNYDGYIAANGYVWLSYLSWAGPRRYVAVGPNDGKSDTTWGTGF
jgi:N-acetyl-anhydromuramyl-L-alanine amidase AmpD|nr:MAG TPA: Bifunctional autolysin [Caudoviricetes sp.]